MFNLAMAFKGTVDVATRPLVDDLKWMVGAKDWRDSAARFLFEDAPVPPAALAASSALTLNDAQEIALATAATVPLTVITGPPGTGKSQTVTAIMADAWLRGETVLLSSTNNTPVDDVIDKKARDVDQALVLRTGNTEKRQELGTRLRELVAAASQRSADPAGATLLGRIAHLAQLGVCLARRFERLGVRTDIEQAVGYLRTAVELVPATYPARQGYECDLMSALGAVKQRTREETWTRQSNWAEGWSRTSRRVSSLRSTFASRDSGRPCVPAGIKPATIPTWTKRSTSCAARWPW